MTETSESSGANGYMQGHPIEYTSRRVRGWKLAGRTVERHRNGIVHMLLKKGDGS